MNTTLLLPRYTRGTAPDSRTLARLIAHDVGKPLSWEFNRYITVDTEAHLMTVDLGTANPKRVAEACHLYCDPHDVSWEIRS